MMGSLLTFNSTPTVAISEKTLEFFLELAHRLVLRQNSSVFSRTISVSLRIGGQQ